MLKARLVSYLFLGMLLAAARPPMAPAAGLNLTAAQEAADRARQEEEVRLVIGQLREFASRVQQGLDRADWKGRCAAS